MIQRIQTLYLLLTAAMMTMMVLFPLAQFVIDGREFVLTAFKLSSVPTDGATAELITNTWGLGVAIVAAAALPLVNIFLFRKRALQFRLCMSQFALLLGSIALGLMFYFRIKGLFAESAQVESHAMLLLPMFFPAIAIIFNSLAQMAIRRDIVLVKSLDRVR
jgi:hypothetical protein